MNETSMHEQPDTDIGANGLEHEVGARGEWTCSNCAFENSLDYLRCDSCNQPRPGDGNELVGGDGDRIAEEDNVMERGDEEGEVICAASMLRAGIRTINKQGKKESTKVGPELYGGPGQQVVLPTGTMTNIGVDEMKEGRFGLSFRGRG